MSQFNKQIEDACKIKIIQTIQVEHEHVLHSICLLKDKRLVSGLYGYRDATLEVYNRSYEPQFYINHAHGGLISSLCVLRNGLLVSAGKEIKVWRIDEDDYQLIHTLAEHTDIIYKVIELQDGKIASCSKNGIIKIWDNYNYQCVVALKAHIKEAKSIIEMNNLIFSVSFDERKLKIWDETTYKCIHTINNVFSDLNNGLSKLNDNTLIVGMGNLMNFVDTETYQVDKFKDQSIDFIECVYVSGNRLVFIGNYFGYVFCYDSSSKQTIFKSKFHDKPVSCLVESENNAIISCSLDNTINIFSFKI